jgi:hypothetical protein
MRAAKQSKQVLSERRAIIMIRLKLIMRKSISEMCAQGVQQTETKIPGGLTKNPLF